MFKRLLLLGVLAALAAIGDTERNVSGVFNWDLSENRLNVRGISIDIGHHYDDVSWKQRARCIVLLIE